MYFCKQNSFDYARNDYGCKQRAVPACMHDELFNTMNI